MASLQLNFKLKPELNWVVSDVLKEKTISLGKFCANDLDLSIFQGVFLQIFNYILLTEKMALWDTNDLYWMMGRHEK